MVTLSLMLRCSDSGLYRHRVSQLFRAATGIRSDPSTTGTEGSSSSARAPDRSRSKFLLTKCGLIKSVGPGLFSLTPLFQRSLDKIQRLADKSLTAVGAQKITMPALSHADFWSHLKDMKDANLEIFKIKDRHGGNHVLNPTHEPLVASLVESLRPNLSEGHLPIKLYQNTWKYRDESNPRLGLLRAREFLMNDLYTFDSDLDNARRTYDEILDVYSKFFSELGVPFVQVKADPGIIGGELSHEYHIPAQAGEDILNRCSNCEHASLFSPGVDLEREPERCSKCGSEMHTESSIEVAHTFLLRTKYSEPFNAVYASKPHKNPIATEMGSYGLGLTRIIASAVEVLSTDNEIRWPEILAPFQICLLLPKSGSKEALHWGARNCHDLYRNLTSIPGLSDDVIVDDRNKYTIGWKLKEANQLGYPLVVVVGKKIMNDPPLLEVINVNQNRTDIMTIDGLLDYAADIRTL